MQTHLPAQSQNCWIQARENIRVKHYSLRTEQTYAGWIKRFILFQHKRYPKDMGAVEVEAFLTHLAVGGMWRLRHRIQAP